MTIDLQVMRCFGFFLLYLILFLSSPVITVAAIIRRNWDVLGAMPVLFFYSLIGLDCNYWCFVRAFSALFGISWANA